MRKLKPFLCAIFLGFGSTAVAQVQQNDVTQLEQAPFASENAIIDTSIPFAIGSREAQQSLRGAFGWPTFQEGLVQGVYFRFDPDGYARFAPTPRLDTDVFEVICRPRTYSCMGRKGSFSIILNSRGQLQLKIDDVLSGDRFFVSEGVSEIEVPERILQPLDTQLELLLSAGGDLIVRRNDTEKDRISLTGFMPVSAYLRWVAARQDYTILPRGWPIPNAAGPEGSVTQATTWQSPMPQPQNFPTGQNVAVQNQLQPVAQPLQLQPQIISANSQTDVDEVKTELKILRELLLQRNQDAQPAQPNQMAPTTNTGNGSIAQLMPQTHHQTQTQMQPSAHAQPQHVDDQIAALQQASAQIQADLRRLTQPQAPSTTGLANINLAPAMMPKANEAQAAPSMMSAAADPAMETAKRLQYLMSEIGLDAKTALMLIQMGDGNAATAGATPQAATATAQRPTPQQEPQFQDDVVAKILRELESDLIGRQQPPRPETVRTQPIMSDADFMLLSRYFKSVITEP